MARTFYDVLGVSPSATPEEIETAYRKRLKETHPDVSDDERAGEEVKAVIQAGDILTDPDERERYDRLGHEAYVSVTDRQDPSRDRPDRPNEPAHTDRSTDRARRTDVPGDAERTETGNASRRAKNDTHRARNTGRTRTDTHRARDASRRTRNDSHGSQTESAQDGSSGEADTDRWRDPNTANANPDGVDWVGAEREVPRESASQASLSSANELSVLFLLSIFGYPILVMASVYPPFPLVFRIVIAACTIAVVIYLVTVPRVSAPAFGFWTAVVGGAIYFEVIGFPSAVSVGGVIVTAMPFALSLFVLTLRL